MPQEPSTGAQHDAPVTHAHVLGAIAACHTECTDKVRDDNDLVDLVAAWLPTENAAPHHAERNTDRLDFGQGIDSNLAHNRT